MPEPVTDPVINPLAERAGQPVAPSLAVAAEPPQEIEAAPTQNLGVMGWLSVLWLGGIVLAAVLAPVLPLRDPGRSVPGLARQGVFQSGGILGGDSIGRDMLSQTIFGTRWTLTVAASSVVLALLVGGILGLLAGYFRGWVDAVLSPVFNVFLAIPGLVLLIAIVGTFAPADVAGGVSATRRAVVLVAGLAIAAVPILARIARASALSWSQREFVRASTVLGARHGRTMAREVLPNALPAMLSFTLLGIAVAIVLEGTLALLGAGMPDDVVTWGNIIALGQGDLSRAPHIVVVPSIAIFLTVLSLNYLGDVVRARFDVRESLL